MLKGSGGSLDIESYIPAGMSNSYDGPAGRVVYRLRASTNTVTAEVEMPQSVLYTERMVRKVLDTVVALLIAMFLLGMVILHLFISEVLNDFYIMGPVLTIFGCAIIFYNVIANWRGLKWKRTLLIDDKGLVLDGGRAISWDSIANLIVKEFPGPHYTITKSFLVIGSNDDIISQDLSDLKSNKPKLIVLNYDDVEGIKCDLTYYYHAFIMSRKSSD